MQHDPRAWLWDIREAADAAARFTQGLDLSAYLANSLVRAAVERQFEIIGEALNRLAREAPDLAARIPSLRQAIAMRNLLIHAYRGIDHHAVWQTLQDDLPTLRAQAAALLTELGETP